MLPTNGKAVRSPVYQGCFLPPDHKKGGLTMVTYSDLIQIGILVVAILSLIVQINQAKK